MSVDQIVEEAVEAQVESRDSTIAAGGKPKKSKNKLFILLAVILVVGGYCYYSSLKYVSTDDAFIDGKIVTISPKVAGHVAKVYVSDNQYVEAGELLLELFPDDYSADLDAAKAKLTSAQATYESSKLNIDLTSMSSNSEYDQARANLAAAEAEINIVKSQALSAVNERDQQKAKLDAALADLESAKMDMQAADEQHERDLHDLNRSQKLVGAGAISKREFDHAQTTEKISAASLSSAKKDLDSFKAQVELARAELMAAENNLLQTSRAIDEKVAEAAESRARLQAAASAPTQIARSKSMAEVDQADVQEAQANLKQAELNLSYTRIYAPVSGVVTSKNVEQGVYVKVGQSLLALVSKELWVTANFKETQLEHMHPGQTVNITVDAYPDIKITGKVDSIQHGTGAAFSLLPPDNATGNFVKVVQRVPVKIVFDNRTIVGGIVLGPGMSVVPEVNVSGESVAAQ